MVRGLAGSDDVELSAIKWQAGRIRSHEENVSSVARRGTRERYLLMVDVDAHHTQPERIGDEQRSGAIATTDVKVRPVALDRQVTETPHRFLGYPAAVPDVVDETLFDARHSHGNAPSNFMALARHDCCFDCRTREATPH
jgi:hypothetical protein